MDAKALIASRRELREQFKVEQVESRYCQRSSARENMASMRSIVVNTDLSFCASVLRGPDLPMADGPQDREAYGSPMPSGVVKF